jgi:hypothetical protein
MGTNFYWKKFLSKKEGEHIGKRSAAGLFCWNCGITLCKDGVPGIHRGKSAWYESCPNCGKKHEPEDRPIAKAASIELGFSKARDKRPVGVHSCSSFTWGQSPYSVISRIRRNPFLRVMDEYERSYSGRSFLKMIKNNCPISFEDSVGRDFS